MKYYKVERKWGAVHLLRNDVNITDSALKRSLAKIKHSPTGFEFGYGGSGPAQLAHAILLDCFCDPYLAEANHQQFKRDFLIPVEGDTIEIDERTIIRWLAIQSGVEKEIECQPK